MEQRNLGTDQLKIAVAAFLRDPLHAVISLIFALFQDLFVLVAGIGAEYFRRYNETPDGPDMSHHFDVTIRESDSRAVAARKVLMHLATAQPGGAFYLIHVESPEWKEQSQVYGENLNHVLNELISRKLAKVIPQGTGRAYRIERRGYQEITKFVADAQKAPAPPPQWQPGLGPGTGRSGLDAGAAAPTQRPRREILSEWVGPKPRRT
jgi:hypothetical protein